MRDSQVLQQHGGHVRFLLRALIVRRGQGHPERAVRLSDAECSHVFRGHVMDHLQRFFAILQKNATLLQSTVTTQELEQAWNGVSLYTDFQIHTLFMDTEEFTQCKYVLIVSKASRK